jgi:hypothetical protein
MKFTFGKLQSNAINLGDKKKTINAWNLIAFKDGKFIELATVRWYMGRSSSSTQVKCSAWFHSAIMEESHAQWTDCSGSGKAGGGGCCKQSAAFSDAMRNAGIKCDTHIEGRGMGLVADALLALAKQQGFYNVHLVRG